MIVAKSETKILELLKSYGVKDYSRLQKVPVVDKNGHTRMVYKKVGEIKNLQNKNHISDNGNMIIKQGLVKTRDIADYLEKKLKTIGYEVERKHSGLSNSEYITIKNAGNLFGKDESDDIEIRIADHDLPPTYDKQYQGDFDVKSNGNQRGGTNGAAQDYESLIAILAKKKGFNTPEYDKKVEEEKKHKEELRNKYAQQMQAQKDAAEDREWALDYAKKYLPEEYEKIQHYNEKADSVTGDKRKKYRKQLNAILNEIAQKYK